MEKGKRKSVDGIVVRRNPRQVRVVSGGAENPSPDSRILQKTRQVTAPKAKDEDINEFLNELGYERDTGGEIARQNKKQETKTSKNAKKADRAERKARKQDAQKTGKRKGKKKKIILSIVASIFVLGALGGIFGWSYIRDKICQINVNACDFGLDDLWGIVTDNEEPLTPLAKDANGRTNIMVFGTEGYSMDESGHQGFQLTDSMLVLSIDQNTKDIKMFSLPRDLKSKTTCTATAKLNEVYYCTYNKNKDEKAAAQSLMKSAEEITGVTMQYFVHINWAALEQAIDALGGIDIAIEYEGDMDSYTGELPALWTTSKYGISEPTWKMKYANGTVQHLNGERALFLARARGAFGDGYGTGSNFARERNQQSIIKALVYKLKRTNFITDMGASIGILNTIGDNVRMNFKTEEYRTIFKMAGDFDLNNIMSIDLEPLLTTGLLSVPGVNSLECGGATLGCLSYVFPRKGTYNYTDIQTLIAQKFSSDPAVSEGATIDVLNGGAEAGSAKTYAKKLEGKGFAVGKIGDTTKKDFTGLTLVVLKSDMPATRKVLEKMFADINVVEGVVEGVASTADFVLVVGATEES